MSGIPFTVGRTRTVRTATSTPAGSPARGGGPPRDLPRPPPLRHNVAWTMVGNGVYAACQWAILIVIAKLASPETVGQFALGFAVTAPVFLLAGLHLRASQATDAANVFDFAQCLRVRLAGMAVALGITAAFAVLSGYDGRTRLEMLAIGASKAVEGVSDVYYGALQQHERMRPIAISLIWRGISAVGAVGAVLWAGGSLLLAIAALVVVWGGVLVLYDRRAAAGVLRDRPERSASGADWHAIRRIVAMCLPLGVVVMLLSLRVNIPRYFIEGRLGAAELGVFATISSLLTAGNLVVSAIGQSATPRLGRLYYSADVRGFRRLLHRLVVGAALVGATGLAVSLAAGGPLLGFIFGARYARSADVLAWVMGVGIVAFTASCLGYALTATRRFGIQLPLFTGTTVVCAAACLWLVPSYGVVGATWAWGASQVVELVALWTVLELALRRRLAATAP
jgi:O-antigen/teichoic acid export membrane protein